MIPSIKAARIKCAILDCNNYHYNKGNYCDECFDAEMNRVAENRRLDNARARAKRNQKRFREWFGSRLPKKRRPAL